MVTELIATNSIIGTWIGELRDIKLQTDRARFRRNLERIGEIAGYEISKTLTYKPISVQTPLGTSPGIELETQPVLATIFRAGLPLYQGLLNIFDNADNAFIGAYRKHNEDKTFVINQQYVACPDISGRPLIIADTMLATGASLILAIDTLLENQQDVQLHIVCVIASAEAVNKVQQHFPYAHLWIGAIDPDLSENGYIIPGLGDAGDLAFGEKKQY